MRTNYLPPMVGIAMHKGEFCFCTGITPYNLQKVIKDHQPALERRGYRKYDKILMPQVVLYLLDVTKLQIDIDLYHQCTGGRR